MLNPLNFLILIWTMFAGTKISMLCNCNTVLTNKFIVSYRIVLALLRLGRGSLQVEITKQPVHAFILSAIRDNVIRHEHLWSQMDVCLKLLPDLYSVGVFMAH